MAYLTVLPGKVDFDRKALVCAAGGLILLRTLFIVIYRVWFHPLKRIPGPKLASVTYLVEFYYNVIKDGVYYRRIARWHERYGPVVRVTPDEVHISDPDAYDQIYRMGTGFHKDPRLYAHVTGDVTDMLFTMTSNQLHRATRSLYNPLFAKKAVDAIEHIYRAYAGKLCDRLSEHAESNADEAEVNMRHAFGCFVIDSLTQYLFGAPFNLMDAADFSKNYFEMIRIMNQSISIFRMLPRWLVYRLTHLPISMGPLPMRSMHDICVTRLAIVKKSYAEKNPDADRTVFHQLIDAEIKDARGEKQHITDEQLITGAMQLVIAAAASTSDVMATTLLGVLSHRPIHTALKEELLNAFPDKTLDGKRLEYLPFLTACIKEGLRVANPVLARLARVIDTPIVEFHGFRIPKNTVISQSAYFLHNNADIFPSPESYDPRRWLDHPELDKYLVPFSRGHRACLGINLAWNQLYWAIATMILRFPNLRLAESSVQTVEEEVNVDYFLAYVKKGLPEIRVKI